MKKIIANTVLIIFGLGLIGGIGWKFLIQPCVELYTKYGIAGIGTWILVLAIIIYIVYSIVKLIEWCFDNA